jgi:hypothetical protein
MVITSSTLEQLSDTERAELEAWLMEFDRQWAPDCLTARAQQLPATGAVRKWALVEMVKIDLERRWQRNQRVGVEFYLEAFPELASPEGPPFDLVEAEVRVRTQFGAAPTEVELCSRFPAFGDRIREVLFRTEPAHRVDIHTPGPGGDRSTFSDGAGAPRQLSGQFGRYRIHRVIGGGGMGTVYLADDTQLDRAVALKVPHSFGSGGAEARERFRREGRAAAALDHPNLCRVYDVGEHDGVPYLTMAFIEGQPLATPTGGEPSMERIATLVRKVALALAYAHANGVVHRDLKPSNILIDARGEPVVTDFGLARREGSGDIQVTRDGVPLGTPAYMSPEQVTGRASAIGPPTDIFSLGVILYQLLTGQIPFRGGPAEVMVQIAVDHPPPPSQLRPGIDPRLEVACLKALAKNPANRFASMDEFAAALVQEPQPVHRKRWVRAAVAGAALLSVVATVLVIRCNSDDRKSGNPGTVDPILEEIAPPVVLRGDSGAVTAVGFAPGGDVLSADEKGIHVWNVQTEKERVPGTGEPRKRDGVTFSPDGRRFADHFLQPVELHAFDAPQVLLSTMAGGPHTGMKAFAANGKRLIVAKMGAFGEPAALVWDLDANKTYLFTKYANGDKVTAVTLTADGTRGVSASKEGGVRVWEVESGTELRHWPNLPVTAVAFTPDGKLVLTGSPLGALVLRDPATGAEAGRFEGHTSAITAVAFSADGAYLLSASSDGSARLWARDTREEIKRLEGHTGPVLCAVLSSDGARALTGGQDGTVRVWTLRKVKP